MKEELFFSFLPSVKRSRGHKCFGVLFIVLLGLVPNVNVVASSVASIKLSLQVIVVPVNAWQFVYIQAVPVTINVTITNESPYTSGTLHYQITNLDTNTTVTDWTAGESVLIDAKTNTNVTIQTTVPIQRNF